MACPGAPASLGRVDPEVSPEQARAAVAEGARLVDVRTDAEWDELRIAGAEHVRLDELQGRAGDLADAPVVFYCRTGERSAMAAEAFRAADRDAATMAGGIEAWQDAGLPVET